MAASLSRSRNGSDGRPQVHGDSGGFLIDSVDDEGCRRRVPSVGAEEKEAFESVA